MKTIIHSDSAPAALGTYSQAVKVGDTVYLSGQVGLDPASMELVSSEFADQLHQVFKNLKAVCTAAGGSFEDVVKLNIYLLDMGHFAEVNAIMGEYFSEPYPARAAIAVADLPKSAVVEIDGVMVVSG